MQVLDRNALIAVTRPNWSQPVRVEYTFKTSIFTARDGTEQRSAQRRPARMATQFVSTLSRAGLIRHRGALTRNQLGPMAVPDQASRANGADAP